MSAIGNSSSPSTNTPRSPPANQAKGRTNKALLPGASERQFAGRYVMKKTESNAQAVQTTRGNYKAHTVKQSDLPVRQLSAMRMAVKDGKNIDHGYGKNKFWPHFSQNHRSQNNC
jgi:hypothetical protein